MDMRKLMNLVEGVVVSERYTSNNSWLHQYLKNGEFDPYSGWHWICEWLADNDHLDEVSEALGREITDADELREEEPEVFYKLPEHLQRECAENVIDIIMQHEPEEAPSWAFLDNRRNQLLPRNTWLVHFTDDPYGIASKGFVYGVDQMDKLGLTTYFRNEGGMKARGGYNFAFLANSRDAKFAADKGKYGHHAVVFQNSGVHAYHNSDEENQIIFWGADVSPNDIIVLENEYGDWHVKSRSHLRNGKTTLFSGDFENCIKWIIQNANQYRKKLNQR
jgi:hypothetical protein